MLLNTAKLRSLLWQSRKTQTEIAKELSCSRNTISAVFNGKSCRPDTAAKIADALNVSLSEITR